MWVDNQTVRRGKRPSLRQTAHQNGETERNAEQPAARLGDVASRFHKMCVCPLTIKLTHEGRPTNSRIANQHGAALIVCSAWFGIPSQLPVAPLQREHPGGRLRVCKRADRSIPPPMVEGTSSQSNSERAGSATAGQRRMNKPETQSGGSLKPVGSEYRANFLWPHSKGSIQEAGYEFANGRTEAYRRQWWKQLLRRAIPNQ